MSLISLPIEIVTQIFNFFDESEPQKPHRVAEHKEMCKTLMALRLTCRELEEIARRPLFRTFCLWPSLKSWKKLHSIMASEQVRVYLQILAFENYPDRSIFNCWEDWNENTVKRQQGKNTVRKSSDLFFLDFSLLSNLKVLKAKDCWLITKMPRSTIKIPWGRCQLRLGFYRGSPGKWIFWDMLIWLVKITHYEFEISSLNCELGPSGPLKYLLNFDFSGLKYLRLYFENSYLRISHALPMDLKILDKLQNLPNLENFLLDESYDGYPAFRALMPMMENERETYLSLFRPRYIPDLLLRIHSTTNVLQKLRDKQWPRLCHLELRSLNTTVADFQAFTKPHAGWLKSFQLINQLRCADKSVEEEARRHDLTHWIQTVLCPQGGETKVKIVDEVAGYYGCEDWDGNAAELEGLS